eukprot:6472243-Amphidinium_carterae.1
MNSDKWAPLHLAARRGQLRGTLNPANTSPYPTDLTLAFCDCFCCAIKREPFAGGGILHSSGAVTCGALVQHTCV